MISIILYCMVHTHHDSPTIEHATHPPTYSPTRPPPGRSASSLGANAWSYAAIPLIYLFMFATRALSLLGFNPLFRLLGTGAQGGTLRDCFALLRRLLHRRAVLWPAARFHQLHTWAWRDFHRKP